MTSQDETPWRPFVRTHEADHESFDACLIFPTNSYRWLVRLHDTLQHLSFNVTAHPCLPESPDNTNECVLEHRRTTTALEQNDRCILIWPDDDQGATETISAALQKRIENDPRFHLVVVTDKQATADDLVPGCHLVNVGLDELTASERGPTWEQIGPILEGLRLAIADKDLKPQLESWDAQIESFLSRLENDADLTEEDALDVFHDASNVFVLHTPHVGCQISSWLIGKKSLVRANTCLEEQQMRFPGSVRVQQLLGHIERLNRNPRVAQSILDKLVSNHWQDPETLGILAASWAVSYEMTGELTHLEKSRAFYAHAFKYTPTDTYVGINAASKSAFLSANKSHADHEEELDKARTFAERVEAVLQPAHATETQKNDYWYSATVAEVYLLKRDYSAAKRQYRIAASLAKDKIGYCETTWIQAQRLMDAYGVAEEYQSEIAAMFANLGPRLELDEEVRLAIVMYGGVSLAIYINGVAQELLNLVRATAPLKNADQTALPVDSLRSTEKVYRKLAQGLSADRLRQPGVGDHFSPIRKKFVIDILSGTSAGGINAIFLAKAMANNQLMDQIKGLWVKEADIDVLINDRDKDSPKSLLDSNHMYRKLLEALEGMQSAAPNVELLCANELDLFVTATDLHGLVVKIPLHDRFVTEKRHRSVFHFRHVSGDGLGRKDFEQDNNPFLAFAARCTSAFPFAFEPMKLEDIDQLVPTIGRYKRSTSAELAKFKSTSENWQKFYEDYMETDPQTGETSNNDFAKRPFGDGGYLDNKPFSHAIRTLMDRHAGYPVDRKLIYIEPNPKEVRPAQLITDVNVVQNVLAALVSLPRYETIREDVEEVERRNRIVRGISRTTDGIEDDFRKLKKPEFREKKITYQSNWLETGLSEMMSRKGLSYGGYHRLKIRLLIDEIAAVLVAAGGFRRASPESIAIRYVVESWVEKHFVEDKQDATQKTQNEFLVRFDLDYRIRRLHFILAKVDELEKGQADVIATLENVTDKKLDEKGIKLLQPVLSSLKPQLNWVVHELNLARSALRSHLKTENPLAATFHELGLTNEQAAQFLVTIASLESETQRKQQAQKTLDHVEGKFETIASKLAEIIRRATMRASRDCVAILEPASPDEKSVQNTVLGCLWHYYKNFEDYDQVTLPALTQSGIGEATEVDILRISPNNEIEHAKLAGTAMASFGGFLKESWRTNDILMGRLHAAERIIGEFTTRREPEYSLLLNEAYDTILEEELKTSGQREVARLLQDAVEQSAEDDVLDKEKRDAISQRLAEPPFGNIPMDKDGFRDWALGERDFDRQLDAKQTANVMGRSTQVFGKILQDLSTNSKTNKLAVWVTRLGRWFTNLFEVSVPGSLRNLFFRHWLALFYLFEIALFVGGSVFANTEIQQFAFKLFAITAAVHVSVKLLVDFFDEWKYFGPIASFLRTLLKIVLIGALAWFMILGFISAWLLWFGNWGDQFPIVFGRIRFFTVAIVGLGFTYTVSWLALGRPNLQAGTRIYLSVLGAVTLFVILVFLAAFVDILSTGRDWGHLLPRKFLPIWWNESRF